MERFAILIGIDDQDLDGLPPYCTKDVDDIAQVLEQSCEFKKKYIFKIQSPQGKENKFSLAELDSVVDILIKQRKISADDLLFIYFSGHGKFDAATQESNLVLPDGHLPTSKIKKYVDQLHPKIAILLLDACFIGAKVYSKAIGPAKLKRKFYVDSEAVYGIYASPTTREAYMPQKLTNSLLTHFFINTVNSENYYDEDNQLSIEQIASICAKQVYKYSAELVKSKHISKEQVIVREGRIEGFLPFAQISDKPALYALESTKKSKSTATAIVPVTPINMNKAKVPKMKSVKEEIDEFEGILGDIKNKLKKFDPVIAATILSSYYNKPYNPTSSHQREIEEAIRKNIIDEEGEVYYRNKQVADLIQSLDDLNEFLRGDTSNEFDEYFNAEYDISPYDLDNQDFWEQIYDLEVPKY